MHVDAIQSRIGWKHDCWREILPLGKEIVRGVACALVWKYPSGFNVRYRLLFSCFT